MVLRFLLTRLTVHGSPTTYPGDTYPGDTKPSHKRSAGLEETCGSLPAREFVRPSRLVSRLPASGHAAQG